MSLPLSVKQFTWRPIEAQDRLEQILCSWEGTPYRLNQAIKRRGVDCVRFVASVADELFRRIRVPLDRLPDDAMLHCREKAFEAMRLFLSAYQPLIRVTGQEIEPGDMFVTGPKNGGPGHVMIAGSRQSELWHTVHRVCRTGTAFETDGPRRLFAVYRSLEKASWI